VGELLRNVRAAGAAGALICATVALGVYQPDDAGHAALTTLVAVAGGGAVAAVVARFAAARKPDENAK